MPQDLHSGGSRSGPLLWENWFAFSAGLPSRERMEAALYSDAQITDSIARELEPHSIIDAGARRESGLALRIIARIELHDVRGPSLDLETSADAFHGGDLFDEIAALLSLALGIRCQSGGMVRTWGLDFNADPLGQPIEFFHRRPYLPPPGPRGSVLPRAASPTSIRDALPVMRSLPTCSPADATAVVRSARSYQRALWVADDDPSQAWLHLVSAVETASNAWKPPKVSPAERLHEAWPELAVELEEMPEEAGARVAMLLAPLVRSQRRFLRFLARFQPEPPEKRPPNWACVDWSELSSPLRLIYDYRSKALHAGTPFPVPMCEPPERFDNDVLSERPTGLAASALGSSWRADDAPMVLSTFEYLVRGALLRWWAHVTASKSRPSPMS